jgi:hypothetical protein
MALRQAEQSMKAESAAAAAALSANEPRQLQVLLLHDVPRPATSSEHYQGQQQPSSSSAAATAASQAAHGFHPLILNTIVHIDADGVTSNKQLALTSLA